MKKIEKITNDSINQLRRDYGAQKLDALLMVMVEKTNEIIEVLNGITESITDKNE